MGDDQIGRFGVTPVVVGVDGGGTGSRAVVLGSGGKELARSTGEAALVRPGAEAESVAAIRHLVARALEAAGVSRLPEALVAGVAGVGREENRLAFRELLRGAGLAEWVEVRTDVEVAFHDAFGGGPGALLVGGTGSVAMTRTPGGQFLRSGGWGALVGDEGSGWWIGVAGARAILQAEDGRGPATRLTDSLPQALGVSGGSELMERFWTAAKGEVAALAPLVAQVAGEGDPVAQEILDGAVTELAGHLAPLFRAWEEEGAPREIPVALVGGLIAPGGPLHDPLVARIRSLGGVPLPETPDPAAGAARLALEAAEGG